MTYAEAIEYLQPIADSSSLKRYSVALNKAIDAMREMRRIEDMKPLVIDAKVATEVHQMMQECKFFKTRIKTVESDIIPCRICRYYRSDPLRDDIGFCVARQNINTTKPDGFCDLSVKMEE